MLEPEVRILAAARLKTLVVILALVVAQLLSAIRKKQSIEFVLFYLHLSKESVKTFLNDFPLTAKEDLEARKSFITGKVLYELLRQKKTKDRIMHY